MRLKHNVSEYEKLYILSEIMCTNINLAKHYLQKTNWQFGSLTGF